MNGSRLQKVIKNGIGALQVTNGLLNTVTGNNRLGVSSRGSPLSPVGLPRIW